MTGANLLSELDHLENIANNASKLRTFFGADPIISGDVFEKSGVNKSISLIMADLEILAVEERKRLKKALEKADIDVN